MESLERNTAYPPLSYEVFEIENARWNGSGVFGAKTDCSHQAD